MDDNQKYEAAKQRVRKLADFYQHLGVYVLVNAGLTIYNLLTDQNWFIYPLLGWGIGIVAHGLSVFAGGLGKSWEEKKIREIMEKGKF
jgi:predicted membrane channel-forming protein YqfA (hemolysin III family)